MPSLPYFLAPRLNTVRKTGRLPTPRVTAANQDFFICLSVARFPQPASGAGLDPCPVLPTECGARPFQRPLPKSALCALFNPLLS